MNIEHFWKAVLEQNRYIIRQYLLKMQVMLS